MNEPRSIHAAEDWGVVLQSVPSKNKRGIVKRLGEIFGLDKHDAEQILSNMPLILVDNISFGLAARIKKFFQTVGAVAETTNHDMIKKNCFQVLWPQTPDLSFFLKNETGPAVASGHDKKGGPRPEEIPPVVISDSAHEERPDFQKARESLPARPSHEPLRVIPQNPPASPNPAHETPAIVPLYSPVPERPVPESQRVVSHQPPVPPKPVHQPPVFVPQYPMDSETPVPESPKIVSQPHPVSEEKPAVSLPSSVDSDWERRAKELNEKLRKFHDEKKELHVQHVEETEKVKNELHQRIEKEKQKAEEIAKKAHDDLQKEAQKHEALTREGEEWRSKAVALNEKVRELESNLTQKTSALEHLVQQKEDLTGQAEKAAVETQKELSALRSREAEAQRELSAFRNWEQESSRKISGLERNVQEMTESLRSRDGMLAQFEKQILELGEKAQGLELLRQEHAQLSKERATIRQEYEAKFTEQEVRLAKDEEEQRRYRSRTDRKNAAAIRELGEWIRGLDTIRGGLQKLILFLGSEPSVIEKEKKSLRSPLTRGPDSPNTEKS